MTRHLRILAVLFVIALDPVTVAVPSPAQQPDRQQSRKATAARAPATDVAVAEPVAGDDLPYKYLGHRISHKFHRPWCPFAQVMRQANIERFHFRFQAIEAGFKPCRYCLPPFWTQVHAKILTPLPESGESAPASDSGAETPAAKPPALRLP